MLVSDSVNQGTSTVWGTRKPVQLVVYKQGSKAKERKGEEEQRRLMFYAIFASRDRNLRQFTSTVILSKIVWNCLRLSWNYLRLSATIYCYNPPFSTSAVILPPPSEKACPQALYVRIYVRGVFLSIYLTGSLLSSLYQHSIHSFRYFGGPSLLGY